MKIHRRKLMKMGTCALLVAPAPLLFSQLSTILYRRHDIRIQNFDSGFVEINGWVLPVTDLKSKDLL